MDQTLRLQNLVFILITQVVDEYEWISKLCLTQLAADFSDLVASHVIAEI